MNSRKYFIIFIIFLAAIGGYILANNDGKPSDDFANAKQLVVTGRCNPVANKCKIIANTLKLSLRFKAPPSYQRLLPITLDSETPLSKVTLSLIINGEEAPPQEMKPVDDNKHWSLALMPFANVSNSNLKVHLIILNQVGLHVATFPISY